MTEHILLHPCEWDCKHQGLNTVTTCTCRFCGMHICGICSFDHNYALHVPEMNEERMNKKMLNLKP